MMRRCPIYFLMAIGLPLAAFTQTQQKIILPAPDPGTILQNNSAGIEIINNTGTARLLGYMATEKAGNDYVAIEAPVDKQHWLSGLATDAATVLNQKGSTGLFIINDLSAGIANGNGYIRLKGRLYESPAGADQYRLTHIIDSFMTGNIPGLTGIPDLFRSLITATAVAPGNPINTAGSGINKTGIIAKEQEQYTFLHMAHYNTGIYQSYDGFKNRKPSYEQFYLSVDTASKSVQINAVNPSDNALIPLTDVWGIAIDDELYIYQNRQLHAAEPVGNVLILSRFIDPATRKNNGKFWRETIGKRLSPPYNNPFNNINTLKTAQYRSKNITGEVIKMDADQGRPEL